MGKITVENISLYKVCESCNLSFRDAISTCRVCTNENSVAVDENFRNFRQCWEEGRREVASSLVDNVLKPKRTHLSSSVVYC